MWGLVCGAAVGATLGLLYAPKPGDAMRKDFAATAQDLKRRATRMYDTAADTISGFAANVPES